jgi:hypothetical protein
MQDAGIGEPTGGVDALGDGDDVAPAGPDVVDNKDAAPFNSSSARKPMNSGMA